ncbi:MAG: hypothetical protein J5673_02645 [Candidatus Methanomethylophilaceae archaeon]|nr:hypothetical protein [Candidatus Methanomethylophilaceae archaeon]
MDQAAVELLLKGYNRGRLSKDDCRYLLSFQEFSAEAIFTRDLFTRFFRDNCANTAAIGAQIGIYTGPCSGNCGFCNFGAGHTMSKTYIMPDDVLIGYLDECSRYGDVSSISLMTNQDCPIDILVHSVEIAKDYVPKGTEIMVNTGDRSVDDFMRLKDAGAVTAYHVCRMGEGRDTAFDPKDRIQTMRNIKEAGLNLMTCTEPVGAEHTVDEVIGNYFGGMEGGCDCGYLALRMPVFGTPMGGMPTLSIKRYHQMQSVLGLASAWHDGGRRVTGWDTGYFTGLNTLSAEFAGSPRDSAPFSERSAGHTLEWCRRTLFGDGFSKIRMADGSVKELDVDYLKGTGSL